MIAHINQRERVQRKGILNLKASIAMLFYPSLIIVVKPTLLVVKELMEAGRKSG